MPNIVRQVTRVELTDLGLRKQVGGGEEVVFRVWFGGDDYHYVWAKDELEAFKRATRGEHEDTQSK